MTNFDPQVGDQCHWRIYSDIEPCTVIKRTATTVVVRTNRCELVKAPAMVPGGFAAVVTENAKWHICSDFEDRSPLTFSKRKNGLWMLSGSETRSPGNVLCAGWHKYYDYGF